MEDDFSQLNSMIYSGRGITVGMTPDGNPFVGYTLTGRSPSSQARRLVIGEKTGIVRTELVEDDETLAKMFYISNAEELNKLKLDIAKGSRALIVYPAIMPVEDKIVVSNGAQTKLLYNAAINWSLLGPMPVLDKAFSQSFFEYDEKADRLIDITSYEPDNPNFTPRISACLGNKTAGICIIKKGSEYVAYKNLSEILLTPGEARGITTYSGGNENPLAPFNGELLNGKLLEFDIRSNNTQEICHNLYMAIGNPNPNDNNKIYRVAAAVMMKKKDGLEFAVLNRADGY